MALSPREINQIIAALVFYTKKVTGSFDFRQVVRMLDGHGSYQFDAPMTTEEINLLILELQNMKIEEMGKEKALAEEGALLCISVLWHKDQYYAFESPTVALDLEKKLALVGQEAHSEAIPITPHNEVMKLFAQLAMEQ